MKLYKPYFTFCNDIIISQESKKNLKNKKFDDRCKII